MKKTVKRTSLGLVKTFLAYIICLSTPKSIVDAINEAASVEELDGAVEVAAGVAHADFTRISNS